jgi:hypothetical protein
MQAMRFTRIIWMLIFGAMIFQTAEAQRRPRIISPEVKSDRTVAFRFHAPRAHQVLVAVEYLDGLRPLRLGENGVWAITRGLNVYTPAGYETGSKEGYDAKRLEKAR